MPFLALAGDDRLGGVQGLIAAYLRAGGRRSSIFGKPHPGFFRQAKAVAARHGAADSLCVVGASLAQDVEGAKRAGLPVAWLYVPLGPSGFDPRLSPTLEVMDHDGATKLATVTGPCC